MQPPKAMGSSLVKILFHICFLNNSNKKNSSYKLVYIFYRVWGRCGGGGGGRERGIWGGGDWGEGYSE